ncbi:MAG TPA: hypothetical protein VHN15_08150 [Thermoanaerobaculia bacterium]|nr:hypothetical protein [Thermoanaerobaculia bacterium]
MKKPAKKLQLNRETVETLALDQVTGGRAETGCISGCACPMTQLAKEPVRM